MALVGSFAFGEEPPSSPDVPVAPPGEVVTDIRVEGNRRVEVEAIRRALHTRTGEVFDPTRTGEDLRALWALKYFADIQLLVQRLPKGIVYVVRVQERPAVREVRPEGNDELSNDDLKESITIKPHSILDLDAIRRDAKKIQEKYVEKGFFLAEVNHRLDAVADTNEVDVVFVIREHSKVLVKEIRFLGAEKVPAEDLKKEMITKEGSFLSFLTGDGIYREEAFQRDLAKIQGVYYDRGFVNVKVEHPWTSVSADKRFIFISLKIEEGEQFRISALDFSGDLLVSKEELRKRMGSNEGDLFNRSQIARDIEAINDIYYDDGYAYANISPVTKIDAESRTIALTMDIQKGKQVTIERIEITGNTKTRDKVIRREVRVYEGELFNGSGMKRTRERITALGYFETVEVTHKPGSDDTKVVVSVEVKEKATGTFQVGLGFSSVENFVLQAQVSQNNLFGWGQSGSVSATVSALRSFFQLSYMDPHFFDTDFIFSTDLFRIQADYGGFVRDSIGGDLNFGYHLTEDLMANMTYTREYVHMETNLESEDVFPLANQARNGVTSSVRLSTSFDKRDNRLMPRSGSIHYVSAEFAPAFLGGTLLFARYTGYTRWYFPLFWGIVFKTNATLGYIQQLDATQPLPISELYYLGGISTVRGYLLRSLTPTLLVGSSRRPDAFVTPFPVGGDKEAIFNFELEFPIFEKIGIRGVVFYDAGNAFARGEPFFTDRQDDLFLGVFHSTGFGFRWFSPIGPLRFEWGIPLNPREGRDLPILFEFTIGNSF